MYLLDTNVCIHFLNGTSPSVEKHFRTLSPSQIAICSIVKAELLFGARNSLRMDANLQRLKLFFAPLQSLPFDDLCVDEYGLIRSDLTARGRLIGPNDMLIAAVARAHNAVLITHNTREFSRITGLQLDDWET
ncbi:type II toxin-antitoxin system tRNA(fMet)-specific endonuclease VapC [Desulfotignum balticum]|uniref:type II toxin-antitoxin system tRNA(fMet)-specific endonuclease VapC n=1 Tax=Desulfotignum balticum TaxID=115781 RepID=UPI000462D0B1|nr:type II toxin-antitoxin system VapC family toxin [Desulfotignum balticum]